MSAIALAMDGDMTIVHAAAQREQLLAAVQGAPADQGFALDLAKVDGIDSAGLQLLVATQHSLQRNATPLGLRGSVPAVQDAIGVYGLQTLLPQDTGASA